MKFSSSTLVLFALGASSSSLLIHGSKVPIDRYELLAAGQPYGEVLTLEPFDAKVYYESKTGANILTDVYKNVTAGSPCSSGTNITNINTALIPSGPAYDTTTSDGKIISVQLTTADIKSTGAYMAVGANDGKVNLCVRSYLSADYNILSAGNELVSFVDTHIMLNVDFEAKFQNFTQEVNITATASKNFTQNITKDVDVETFLCAPGSNASTSYKIGQDFSVCVRPTAKYVTEGYSVNGFANVTCENTGASRELVKNAVADVLTTVQSASGVSTYLDSNGTKVGNATAAFGSVVTAGYFSSSESSFTCSGDASLTFTPPVFCKVIGFLQTKSDGASAWSSGMCVKNVKSVKLVRTWREADGMTVVYTDRVTGGKMQSVVDLPYYGHSGSNQKLKLKGGGDMFCGADDIYLRPTHDNAMYSDQIFDTVHWNFEVGNEGTPLPSVEVCILSVGNTNPGFAQSTSWNMQQTSFTEQLDDDGFASTGWWYCPKIKFGPMEMSDCPDRRKLESAKFENTFGFSRSAQDDSATSASSFATKIGLNSEGTEAITASSAVAYDGLFSIAVYAVSLFFMFSEVME